MKAALAGRYERAMAAAATLHRKALRAPGCLLGRRDLGDRRQRDDRQRQQRCPGGADRPQPRLRQHSGRDRAGSGVDPPPGAGSSAPVPSGSASSTGGPLASPEPTPTPAASGPVSESAPKEPAAAPSSPQPEAGRVKHAFVISLHQPGLRTVASAPNSADAIPLGDPAPAGRAAEQLLAARRSRASQPDRRPQRPAAERGHRHQLPHLL